MNILKRCLMISLVLFIGASTFASDDITYQGYYVSSIIDNTTSLFFKHGLLKLHTNTSVNWHRYQVEAADQQSKGMLPTFPFIDFEQTLLNHCLNENLISIAQGELALDKCKHFGGLTINGYNLLIFHTYILIALIDNKHITKQEAQNLLDKSKNLI